MELQGDQTTIDQLTKELAYYKRQLDKLTGDHLRNQYVISRLNTTSKEYENGFQILADVHRSFSFLKPMPVFHEQVLEAMIARLNVDCLYLLKYDSAKNILLPYIIKGSPLPEESPSLTLPGWCFSDAGTLYAGIDTALTDTELYIREQLKLPYFILTALTVNGTFWGALYAGRKHQIRPIFQPFSSTDIHVFEAITGMLGSLTHQLNQHNALEKERNRIAQEMHDDIGSGLTHIALLSELLQVKNTADIETLSEIAKIATVSRSLTDSISEIIWALNPQYGTLSDLLTYLREQTNTLFDPFAIEYRISFPSEMPEVQLNNQQRRNLYLVVKEALNNSLKHSGASRIELKLAIEQQNLCFTVQDNGKGMDISTKRTTANGIQNFTHRMDDIGGRCLIESDLKGTIISFFLPFE